MKGQGPSHRAAKPPARRRVDRWALLATVTAVVLTLTAWLPGRIDEPGLPPAASPTGPGPTTAPVPPAGPVPANRSGLPWPSGANADPNMDIASIEAFGAWRGRPVDVVNVFTTRNTQWEPLTRPQELVDAFSGWPGRLVISQPLFPASGNLDACARGDYDQHWREFGSFLAQTDGGRRADSVVRLGWEANGHWFYWTADRSGELFRACWNHAAAAIKATHPEAVLDWTVNAHGTPDRICGGDELNCYPGDQWVDVIGIDQYDHYPPVRTQAEFDATAAATGGIDRLYDFARAHGKLFAVGEWGVSSATTNAFNGGDNAFYVQAMWEWLAERAPYIAYEGYYTNCEPDNVRSDIAPYRGCAGPGQPINPNASARYLALWSAAPTP